MSYTSPNHDSRDGHEIDMLIMHYTGMKTGTEALERLCDPASKVSAHYVVQEDGTVHQLVEESERAWHAGVSSWRGATNINQRSIGIEIVNPGHEFGYVSFPDVQIRAVRDLALQITTRHTIPTRNIVGHSDIAPTRKQDPGELFPWAQLAETSIGLWPCGDACTPASVAALESYGYDISALSDAIIAFQRHFQPHDLSGEWDEACGTSLQNLLDQAA